MSTPVAAEAPTVWVVEDDKDARFALVSLTESVALNAQAFRSGEEFLEVWKPGLRGCIVSDFRLPKMNGLELLAALVERKSELPFIMISGHADVPVAVSAIKQGAFDFLQKPVVFQEALDRIQAAMAEDQRRWEARQKDIAASDALERLTEREAEIMNLMVAGKKSREIAAELKISERTVEIHRARVMTKTGCGSLAELARLVLSRT
ncbi:MAG: response regulator transcription factor [Candidatus Binatia bacterium]